MLGRVTSGGDVSVLVVLTSSAEVPFAPCVREGAEGTTVALPRSGVQPVAQR